MRRVWDENGIEKEAFGSESKFPLICCYRFEPVRSPSAIEAVNDLPAISKSSVLSASVIWITS